MTFRRYFLIILSVIASSSFVPSAFAQQATVLMNASPNVIMADGRSTTTITATVSGLNASQVPDGTVVRFTATSGSLSAAAVATVGGIARVSLTSSPVPGYATISASFVGSNGSGSGNYQVEFTSDKDRANSDQGEADWIRISSPDYLAYSADARIIDASSKDRGVKFSYRGLVIVADALQADMSDGTLRARNAVISRGRKQIVVRIMSYSLTASAGQALVDGFDGSRTVQTISINGADMSVKQLPRNDFNNAALEFVDISNSRVLVTATAVAVRMNDRIQLRHASVYIDSKRIVSMPYQIMPLNTNELFGQQVLGYGSDGLFLDVPYYASVSPKSTGAFYLRSTSAAQQDGTYYNGRQGLALDYVNSYASFDGRTSGAFNVMGLSRNDWGASWTHTQQFNPSLRTYFYVDVPEHNSLFASSNIVQQLRGFSLNLNATQTKSAAISGYSTSEQNIDTYLQSSAHRLNGSAQHGLFYSASVTNNMSTIRTTAPKVSSLTEHLSTISEGMNFFTSPIKVSKSTGLSDSVNFSESHSNTTGTAGVTANAVLNLNTRYSSMANSTFSYSFSHDPVTDNVQSSALLPGAIRAVSDQSNYSFSFNVAPPSNKWLTNFASTYSAPLGNSSLSAGFTYNPTSVWQLGVTEAYSQYAGISFSDLEFMIGRRVGSREFEFYWSSIDRQLRFNMGTAQF